MSDRQAEWVLAIGALANAAAFLTCWSLGSMAGCLLGGVCCGFLMCGLVLRPHQVRVKASAWHWHCEAKKVQQGYTELLYVLLEKQRQIEWLRQNDYGPTALIPERGTGCSGPRDPEDGVCSCYERQDSARHE